MIYIKHKYILNNLNCAHCAAKIENKIIKTDGFENVSLNFATKLLRFDSEKQDLVAEIQKICNSIEHGIVVSDDKYKTKSGCSFCHNHNKDSYEHSHKHIHEHLHEKQHINKEFILFLISIVFVAGAILLHFIQKNSITFWLEFAFSVIAALLSGWQMFLNGIKNIIKLKINEIVLTTIATIAAFCIGEFLEGAMIALLFAAGERIEDAAVDSARKSIKKVANILPDTAIVIKDDSQQEIPVENVDAGDIVFINPHSKIPVDGIVIDGFSSVNCSTLTGESVPQDVVVGTEVLSGCINGERPIKIRATKKFKESTATRIINLVEDAAANKGKKETLISRFAAIYTPVVIIIAIAIAALPPLFFGGDFSEWLYRALTILVASCPCAIVISVPLAYYSGIGAASRIGVLIKGGKFLEALAHADTFAFDKTGTITTGELIVSNIYAADGYSKEDVLNIAAACEKHSFHPIAETIKKSANNSDEYSFINYREIPGCGIYAENRDNKFACGSHRIVTGDIPNKLNDFDVFLTCNDKLIGAFELRDNARPEATGVIKKLKNLGIKKTLMLTGDSAKNSEGISKSLKIDTCISSLLPEGKLKVINKIKESNSTVCFVGDGINDAPVLAASDCGISMGLGSEAAIEASDAVLSSGDLKHLPDAIKVSRRTMNTVKTNIIFAILVKLTVIILAAFGLAQIWMSVASDTGVCVICVLYTIRLLKK